MRHTKTTTMTASDYLLQETVITIVLLELGEITSADAVKRFGEHYEEAKKIQKQQDKHNNNLHT
jgi:hypothetical protein